MKNLKEQNVEFICPNCRNTIKVKINDFSKQKKVLCNCGQTIKLEEKENIEKKILEKFNKMFNNLG